MEPKDQAAGSEAEESAEVKTEEVKTEDNPKAKDAEQSDEGKGEEEASKLFKTPDGRELTAEQLYNEYGKLLPEFTKRSQKLAEIERQQQEAKAQAERETREQVSENDLLKDVDPAVREAIVQIVKPVLEDYDRRKSQEALQAKQDSEFEAELRSLESKHDGKDGLPKFDRTEVLEAMKADGNRIFDPETMYLKLHEKEHTDRLISQALKQKSGGSNLERTGSEEDRSPPSKTPSTFAEAAKRALSRF